MARQYLKINDVDISRYVSELSINTIANYNATTNANGDSLVDWIGSKVQLSVSIICLSDNAISTVMRTIDNSKGILNVEYLAPYTGPNLEAGRYFHTKTITCLCPEEEIEYYTIRDDKVMIKGFRFQLIEL